MSIFSKITSLATKAGTFASGLFSGSSATVPAAIALIVLGVLGGGAWYVHHTAYVSGHQAGIVAQQKAQNSADAMARSLGVKTSDLVNACYASGFHWDVMKGGCVK